MEYDDFGQLWLNNEMAGTLPSSRGRRPVYKGCRILVREVGVKSGGYGGRRPGHKPDDWRTYRLFDYHQNGLCDFKHVVIGHLNYYLYPASLANSRSSAGI